MFAFFWCQFEKHRSGGGGEGSECDGRGNVVVWQNKTVSGLTARDRKANKQKIKGAGGGRGGREWKLDKRGEGEGEGCVVALWGLPICCCCFFFGKEKVLLFRFSSSSSSFFGVAVVYFIFFSFSAGVGFNIQLFLLGLLFVTRGLVIISTFSKLSALTIVCVNLRRVWCVCVCVFFFVFVTTMYVSSFLRGRYSVA